MARDDAATPGPGDAPGASPRVARTPFPHSQSAGIHETGSASALPIGVGTCVQEWTGTQWVVVDSDCGEGYECRALEASKYQGEFVGHRVLTPAVRKE